MLSGQGTQQLVDLDDRLAALGRIGAADVAGQVFAGATDRVELQFLLSDALLPGLIANFRAVAQQQLQASQALHLQQAAQGVVAVVRGQHLARRLLEQTVEILAIVAFGNNAQRHVAGGQQGRQVHFSILEERCQYFPIVTPYR
ncbi:hypothetical protein D3C84_756690 [compost metagenome]